MNFDLTSDGTTTTRAAPEERLIGEEYLWTSPSTSAGMYVTSRTALESTGLLATFNTVATDVASLPLDIYQRMPDKGRRNAVEHPLDEILRRSPDGLTTPIQWKQALMGHTLGHGNGYAEIERTGRGRPYKLHLLAPETTRSEVYEDRPGYRLGNGKWLEAANVVHVAGFGYDGLNGYNFVQLIRQAIGLGAAAESYGADYFTNGGEPNGYIKTPNKLTPAAQAETRSGWMDVHGGGGKRHKVGVLSGGSEWVSTTSDPEKTQLIEARKFQLNDVVRPWRVPPHKVGDFSQAHLANIEASNLDYLMTALMGWLIVLEQQCNLKLLSRAEWQMGYYVEHNTNALLRGDTASRFSAYEVATRNGWMSRDEVRQRENDNPLGEAKGGSIYTVQSQNIPLDQVGKQPAAPPPPATREEERYNPHHGADGKFSSGGAGYGGGAVSGPIAGELQPSEPELGYMTGLGRQFSSLHGQIERDSREQMAGYVEKHYDGWSKGLSDQESMALSAYSGGGYIATNKQLRAGELKPAIKTRVRRMDSALENASTPEDLVTFRGIQDLHAVTGIHQKDAESLVGATIRDKGYLSMTLDRDVAKSGAFNSYDTGATLIVSVPKGSKVAGMDPITKRHRPDYSIIHGEHEMLGARGHGVKITQAVRQNDGRLFLFADLVPPE